MEENMTDNTQRDLLLTELDTLTAWRGNVLTAFERTNDRRYHTELLAADEAIATRLRELRDLTMGSAMGCDLCRDIKAVWGVADGPAFCIQCLGAILSQLDEEGQLLRIMDIIRDRREALRQSHRK